jgi:hypothetical protein
VGFEQDHVHRLNDLVREIDTTIEESRRLRRELARTLRLTRNSQRQIGGDDRG